MTGQPVASVPKDLKVLSCIPNGPFMAAGCSGPIAAIYSQVAANGPFDGVRVTVVGSMDCALPRQLPSQTPKPKDYFWMVRFQKGDQDFGGFVKTGGVLGSLCQPFTAT